MTTICHDNFKLHALLTDQGAYIHEHNPATWEDDGDAENGPCLHGGPAFDRYSGDSHEFIVDSSGEIVCTMHIDWDEYRWFEALPDAHEQEDDIQYERPRGVGEDYIVTHCDEDGPWFACHDYGWTDSKKERGYFTLIHAQQIAEKHNKTLHDAITGRALVVALSP